MNIIQSMKKIKLHSKNNGIKVRDEEHLKAQIKYPSKVYKNKKKYDRKKLEKIDY